MTEKVNPCHPDKVADRIAGAIVDIAYAAEADSEEVENLIERLAELGFEPLPAEESGNDEPAGLTVKVPLENAAVGNLTNLLEAKGGLIKKPLIRKGC